MKKGPFNGNSIILFIMARKAFAAKRKIVRYVALKDFGTGLSFRLLFSIRAIFLVAWTWLLILNASPAVTASPTETDQDRPFISEQPIKGYFPLVSEGVTADVYVDPGDWKVVKIAAEDLTKDVERVTGRKPSLQVAISKLSAQAVLIGTVGRSSLIDRLIKEGRLDVSAIQGKWESFMIMGVFDPLPGVKQGLIIVGSDRRGTAYGVYELSKANRCFALVLVGRRDTKAP